MAGLVGLRRRRRVAGGGSRFVWTVESAWIAFYFVFWIWLLTIAVRLVTGRDVPVVSEAAEPAEAA